MRIPARFVKYAATHAGASSKEGFIELDIRALDLDGVTRLYVNLDDVANVRGKRDEAMGTLEAWDQMFGKKDE